MNVKGKSILRTLLFVNLRQYNIIFCRWWQATIDEARGDEERPPEVHPADGLSSLYSPINSSESAAVSSLKHIEITLGR